MFKVDAVGESATWEAGLLVSRIVKALSMLNGPGRCYACGRISALLRNICGIASGLSGVMRLIVVTILPTIAMQSVAAEDSLEISDAVRAAQAKRIAVMKQAAEATVAIFGLDGGGGGSGVIVSPDGYALTNYHVSSACGDHMRCGLNDGRLYDAVIVGIDATGDVSLIKLLGRDDFPTAPMGNSDQVRVGQWCFASGNPFVLATNLQPSISLGLVSGVNRYQYPAGTLLEYADCIQTDAAINPGNSGGPLFNLAGEVIGINGRCSFEKRGRVNVGVGYAISINQIKYFLGMLKSGRLVDHATLGATVATDEYGGVLVSNILSDSDAYRRGLRYGDEIVSLADREVRTTNMFKNILGTLPKDWRVPVEYRRDGEVRKTLVRLDGVHTESRLIELVSAEMVPGGRPPGGGKPREMEPEDDAEPKDEAEPREHGRKEDESSSGGKSSADAEDGRVPQGQPARPEERGPGARPELARELERVMPDRQLVASKLEKRTGFANYHFNRLHRKEVWSRIQQLGDFSQVDGRWRMTGTLAGESTPALIELSDQSGVLQIGSRRIEIDFGGSMAEPIGGRRESGLLVAMRAWRELLINGPEKIGDTVYLGKMPVYETTNYRLADQTLRDVLQTLWYDATVRYSCPSASGKLVLIEAFGDRGLDPVEVYLDRYETVKAGDEAYLFPRRLRLQYGVEPMLLIELDSVELSMPTAAVEGAPTVEGAPE